MIVLLIAVMIGLLILVTKLTIDVYILLISIRKDQAVVTQPNEAQEKYQFIKGLY